jgi:ceramide glucosyltransferase
MQLATLILATAPFAYYLLCILAAKRFSREEPDGEAAPEGSCVPISILKPVRGIDRGSYKNFASFCQIDYRDYELVFCVGEPADPAVPIIERLIHEHPQRSIRLVVSTEKLGVNDKLNNLTRLVREARHELLVMCDSDVRVEPSYLRAIARAFQSPRVGAATLLFRSDADPSLICYLDCIGSGNDFWSSTLVARMLRNGLHFTHGATMAVRRKLLAEIGGWESRVNHHSDDHWLGSSIAARGHQVALVDERVWMVYPARSLRDYLHHENLRAIRIRTTSPWGYAGLLFTQGLAWAILAAAVAPSKPIAVAYLATYLVLRSLSVWVTGTSVLKDPVIRRVWWLAPLRDAIGFYVWVAGYFSSRMGWRGLHFKSVRGGRLVPIAPRTPRD